MLRKSMALICGATLAMASASAAQDWYGALHVGKGWKEPAHTTFAVTMTLPEAAPWDEFDGTYKADLEYDPGVGVGAAVGRAFGNWRLEGELGYRASKIGGFEVTDIRIDAVRPPPPPPEEVTRAFVERHLATLNNSGNVGYIEITGRARLLTGLLSFFYDLPVDWAVRPYVGVGVGVTQASKKKTMTIQVTTELCATQPASDLCVIQASDHSKEWDANWHVMAGVEWAFRDRWQAGLGWGYMNLDGLSFELSDSVDSQGNPRFMDEDPLKVEKNGMHNLELTLLRRF